MWLITTGYTIRGQLRELAGPFGRFANEDIDIDAVKEVFSLLGYEPDEYLTEPEFDRYVFCKFYTDIGLVTMTIEKEEDY